MNAFRDDYDSDLYTLMDDEGVEETFELIDSYEEKGTLYYAFIPYSNGKDLLYGADDEIVVLKFESDDNGTEILSTIDDDDEFERIGNLFLDRIQEEFDRDCE